MLRKLAIAALTMSLLAGLSVADDHEALETIMKGIQSKTTAFRKATRTAADYKKNSASIVKDCDEVIKLAKESREKEKKPLADWQKLTDDMIHATEELSKIAGDSKSTQEQAKAAFTTYNKTCSACHNVFKKDDK